MSPEFSPASATVGPDSVTISGNPEMAKGTGSRTNAADKASSTIATGTIVSGWQSVWEVERAVEVSRERGIHANSAPIDPHGRDG